MKTNTRTHIDSPDNLPPAIAERIRKSKEAVKNAPGDLKKQLRERSFVRGVGRLIYDIWKDEFHGAATLNELVMAAWKKGHRLTRPQVTNAIIYIKKEIQAVGRTSCEGQIVYFLK